MSAFDLSARWREIEVGASTSACQATEDGAQRFGRHMAGHLEIEESVVFPALLRLPAAELAAIGEEMRARRAGSGTGPSG